MQEPEVRAHLKEAETKRLTMNVELNGISVGFSLANEMSYYRVNTLHTKEPETLAWTLALGPDDVLFDVGANMGLFTVIAAKVAGAKVFAFEPESQNYSLLNKNIFSNGITEKACAYCVAITKKNSRSISFFSAPSVSLVPAISSEPRLILISGPLRGCSARAALGSPSTNWSRADFRSPATSRSMSMGSNMRL